MHVIEFDISCDNLLLPCNHALLPPLTEQSHHHFTMPPPHIRLQDRIFVLRNAGAARVCGGAEVMRRGIDIGGGGVMAVVGGASNRRSRPGSTAAERRTAPGKGGEGWMG